MNLWKLHSTTVPQWLLVFTTDNFRYLTVAQWDWWWYCSDWTCENFSFACTRMWPGELWVSSPAFNTVSLQLLVLTSDNFRNGGIVLSRPLRIFLLPPPGFELGTSGFLVLHSTTVPQWLLVLHIWQFELFNSGAERLVIVLFWIDLWGFYTGIWTRDLWISSLPLYHCATVNFFPSDNFRYFSLVYGVWWWYCSNLTCDNCSFPCTMNGYGDIWISGPALFHCAIITSGFDSDNLRYWTLVQRDWWWYCCDLSCEKFYFACIRNWIEELWMSSPCTLPLSHGNLWISPLITRDIYLFFKGLVVVLFSFYLWEFFFSLPWDLNWKPLDL